MMSGIGYHSSFYILNLALVNFDGTRAINPTIKVPIKILWTSERI